MAEYADNHGPAHVQPWIKQTEDDAPLDQNEEHAVWAAKFRKEKGLRTITELALKYHVHRATVVRICREFGVAFTTIEERDRDIARAHIEISEKIRTDNLTLAKKQLAEEVRLARLESVTAPLFRVKREDLNEWLKA